MLYILLIDIYNKYINFLYIYNKKLYIYIYMSSIQKISLESKTKSKSKSKSSSSSKNYKSSNHKCEECRNYFGRCRCHRRMYKTCCLLLKILIIIIIGYILYNSICNNNTEQSVNSFRLIKHS